jgi:hypothetical protein
LTWPERVAPVKTGARRSGPPLGDADAASGRRGQPPNRPRSSRVACSATSRSLCWTSTEVMECVLLSDDSQHPGKYAITGMRQGISYGAVECSAGELTAD